MPLPSFALSVAERVRDPRLPLPLPVRPKPIASRLSSARDAHELGPGKRVYGKAIAGSVDDRVTVNRLTLGTLWIKEVGYHSLLHVASIHVRFGRTVRALRAKAGYSQESFADAIHIHRTSMGTLERGEGNPRLETILKIARGLDVTLTELFLAVEKDS
jgi:DNA-binding XRE family transcriptional regulator